MAGGFSYADSSLLDELWQTLELDPTNTEAKKLLAGQYQTLGWDDEAVRLADEVLKIHPNDREAQFILESSQRRDAQQSPTVPADDAPPPYSRAFSDGDTAANVGSIQQLKGAYKTLRDEAKSLLQELLCFQKIAPSENCTEQVADLTALTEGRMHSVARRTVGRSTTTTSSAAAGLSKAAKPSAVKVLASSMKIDPDTALDTAIIDFSEAVQWEMQRHSGRRSTNADAARDAVRKRADSLTAVLPKKMAHLALDAFMHVEHEVLKRKYQNERQETMLGDAIEDIPRPDFWVSEDGYAWDMTELVQAIESSGSAMQNPLTHEKFGVSDVEAIIRHPHGKRLAAVQLEQSKLVKGVRQETITRMRELARVVLEDQSVNSHPSHDAVDAFLSYMATLPAVEREALNKLQVPAVDSHTGRAYNATIGDSVRDAKSNQICFHKAGDLLKQAADFLSRSR